MRARLGYAAHTLIGPWIVLVVVGLDAGIAAVRGAPYLGETVFAVRWMALPLWIAQLAVAAIAAVDAARLTAPGRRHLSLASAGGWKEYAWAALWTGGAAAVAHIIAIVAVVAAGGFQRPAAGWGPVALAVLAQASTLLWAAAWGSFVGRHCQPIVAGLVAAVVMYGAELLFSNAGTSGGGPVFFPLGDTGASVTQVGLTWNPWSLAAQIVLLWGTGALLLMPRPRLARGILAPSLASVAAVAIVATALAGSMRVVHAAPMVSTGERPTDCRGQEPVVCLYPSHARAAGPVRSQVEALVAAARAHGSSAFVPARVEEASRRSEPADPKIRTMIIGSIQSDDPVGPASVAEDLLDPTWCPARTADTGPPDRFWQDLANLKLTWTDLVGDPYDPMQEAHKVTPAQARAVLERWAACDLDG